MRGGGPRLVERVRGVWGWGWGVDADSSNRTFRCSEANDRREGAQTGTVSRAHFEKVGGVVGEVENKSRQASLSLNHPAGVGLVALRGVVHHVPCGRT